MRIVQTRPRWHRNSAVLIVLLLIVSVTAQGCDEEDLQTVFAIVGAITTVTNLVSGFTNGFNAGNGNTNGANGGNGSFIGSLIGGVGRIAGTRVRNVGSWISGPFGGDGDSPAQASQFGGAGGGMAGLGDNFNPNPPIGLDAQRWAESNNTFKTDPAPTPVTP